LINTEFTLTYVDLLELLVRSKCDLEWRLTKQFGNVIQEVVVGSQDLEHLASSILVLILEINRLGERLIPLYLSEVSKKTVD
jgi:hypothetical protein